MSIKSFLKSLGPGLITGTADDDPSSIATFAQAGAKFGLGMLWTVIYLIPLIIVIQEICARIGLLTGSGLGTIIKKKYSKKIVTEIKQVNKFYPAEDYHQQYYELNQGENPYCSIVIRPKLEKFRKVFKDKLKNK